MKRFLLLISALALSVVVNAQKTNNVSIFCNHIEDIAKQEHITFADAAYKVAKIGYTGVDVYVTQNPVELEILQSMGFRFPCAIMEVNYSKSDCREMEQATIEFMRKYKIDRVLVVVGLMNEGSYDHDFESVKTRVTAFAEKAEKEGFKVLLEDYDNAASACYNIDRLSTLFAASDKLGHVFDSGNYLFAGDDCLVALDKFKNKVGHVHFKDRTSETDMSCPVVGSGCIPFKKIVKTLKASGYKGWYTAEFFGNPAMLSTAEASFNYINKLLK